MSARQLASRIAKDWQTAHGAWKPADVLGVRAHDSLWEQGNGDAVFAILAADLRASRQLARVACDPAVARYVPAGLLDIARQTVASRVPQPMPAGGLFDEAARAQGDLF
jgi:hypothetical protein